MRPGRLSRSKLRTLCQALCENAAYDLTKITKRIESLADDDRFGQNIENISRRRGELVQARDAIQQVIERMPAPESQPADLLGALAEAMHSVTVGAHIVNPDDFDPSFLIQCVAAFRDCLDAISDQVDRWAGDAR